MTKEDKLLDNLFSDFIRQRAIKETGGCERCLTPKFDIQKENGKVFPAYKTLQCAHFDGRSNKAVRWDEDNAIGACGGCHLWLDAHPLAKIGFFKQKLGEEKFNLLQSRIRNTWPRPDKAALTLYYKLKIKEQDDCNR